MLLAPILTSSEVNMTISGNPRIPFLLISGKALNRAATSAYSIDMLPPGLKMPSPLVMPNNLRVCFRIFISIRVKTGATSNVYLEKRQSAFITWNVGIPTTVQYLQVIFIVKKMTWHSGSNGRSENCNNYLRVCRLR